MFTFTNELGCFGVDRVVASHSDNDVAVAVFIAVVKLCYFI